MKKVLIIFILLTVIAIPFSARFVGGASSVLCFYESYGSQTGYIEGGYNLQGYVLNNCGFSCRASVTVSSHCGQSKEYGPYYLSQSASSDIFEYSGSDCELPVGYSVTGTMDYGWILGDQFLAGFVIYNTSTEYIQEDFLTK